MQPRLTNVSTVYHTVPDVEPVGFDFRYSHDLKSNEPPFTRPRLPVGPEWQPLPLGWVKEASLLLIENHSKDTLLEIGLRVDEDPQIDVSSDVWLVPPGRHFQGYPSDVNKVVIRSGAGLIRCTITVFPA